MISKRNRRIMQRRSRKLNIRKLIDSVEALENGKRNFGLFTEEEEQAERRFRARLEELEAQLKAKD